MLPSPSEDKKIKLYDNTNEKSADAVSAPEEY